jgi:hypothetical protein
VALVRFQVFFFFQAPESCFCSDQDLSAGARIICGTLVVRVHSERAALEPLDPRCRWSLVSVQTKILVRTRIIRVALAVQVHSERAALEPLDLCHHWSLVSVQTKTSMWTCIIRGALEAAA